MLFAQIRLVPVIAIINHTYLVQGTPWWRRRFLQTEAFPLHFGLADHFHYYTLLSGTHMLDRTSFSGSKFTIWCTSRPLGYERVYLPLYKVADTPFHIQGDEVQHCADFDNACLFSKFEVGLNVLVSNPGRVGHLLLWLFIYSAQKCSNACSVQLVMSMVLCTVNVIR